jgi:OmcA/MtrC family decaheme c-type cytochrome
MRTGSTPRLAAGLLLVAALACKQEPPRIGGPAGTAPPPEGFRVVIDGASTDGTVGAAQRVYVNFSASKDGRPLTAAALAALQPSWTLAALGTEPVTGVPAWSSLLLTGAQTVASLPVAGPGTPAANVVANQRQPGLEVGGQLLERGGGAFTYIFERTVQVDATATVRVGLFLAATAGTALTSATLDFRTDGGAVQSRETVLAERCNGCHGVVRAHGGVRTGPSLCVTCHTWQHADPDTMDPAAMAGAGATKATNPNPLEFGRLVHRLHRGRNLPTLYLASTSAPAVALDPPPATIASPFVPGRNALAATVVPPPKFSIVGEQGREHTFGRVATRTDNGQPARTMALGVAFPRDYRSCEACHAGARDGAAVTTEISRRSCQGCHPDVWFGADAPDATHLAHPGGPQDTDAGCGACHLATGATPYAPIAAVHAVPYTTARVDAPVLEIVSVASVLPDGSVVEGLRAGGQPRVRFKVTDRAGTVTPLNTTVPAADENHPIPRALTSLSITVGGPTTDYIQGLSGVPPAAFSPFTESLCRTSTTACIPVALAADAAGVFEYTFTNDVPPTASGTWAVAMEGRRSIAPQRYNPAVAATATAPAVPASLSWPLVWPYTGETVSEVADNPIAYFDLAGGVALPRREVVSRDACNRCHLRLSFHGGRVNPQFCVMCHTFDRTEWGRRPKDPSGNVNLATVYTWTAPFNSTSYGTNDNVEERTLHFKPYIHRIHTGGRSGPAELSALAPFLVYTGSGSTGAKFRDEMLFPGDLADCMRCHRSGTYRPEAVPATAQPTLANETATILHAATSAHTAAEPRTPPIQASCNSCHGTEYARFHAERYTSAGKEQCVSCHGVDAAHDAAKVHGVWDPPAPVAP